MLTIINREREAGGSHGLQAQSGRTECWLEGWIVLPEGLREAYLACGGYCELEIRDGALAGIVPDRDSPAPWLERAREKEAEEEALRLRLSATDYQALKCCEAALLGGEPPYDPKELAARRQDLRDQINRVRAERDEARRRAERPAGEARE
ncbi:MAG: hypothetical protein HFF39_08985 [Lawsonibacter sp.]|nr:hypothetical protein [Lawsonibacter sp.]